MRVVLACVEDERVVLVVAGRLVEAVEVDVRVVVTVGRLVEAVVPALRVVLVEAC